MEADATLAETAAEVSRRTQWKDRSVRPLHPLADEDAALLAAVNRGEFALQGFRNADLRELLFAPPASETDRRRQMTKVTRLIRLLRAHGLVHKVSHSHRYQVSPRGRKTITTLLAARAASSRKLTELAA